MNPVQGFCEAHDLVEIIANLRAFFSVPLVLRFDLVVVPFYTFQGGEMLAIPPFFLQEFFFFGVLCRKFILIFLQNGLERIELFSYLVELILEDWIHSGYLGGIYLSSALKLCLRVLRILFQALSVSLSVRVRS